MQKLSIKNFDYQAERSYYSEPPRTVKSSNYLKPYYQALLGDYCKYFSGKRVLDIGAGECLHGYHICAFCNPKAYINVDIFEDRMKAATEENSFSQMRFIAANCFSLPFNDASFDVVWGNGVLFRLRPLERAVSEINRVLKKDGFYLGMEPNLVNPFLLLKFMSMRRPNNNDGILTHGKVKQVFSMHNLQLEFNFFWKRIPWLKNRFLTSSMGIIARKAL